MSGLRVSAPTTVRKLLREASSRLCGARLAYGHGLATAQDEAAFLVAHALGVPPTRLPRVLSRPVAPRDRRRALRLVEARIRRRIPVAYLTHEAWLGGLRFHVDRRVIVPRSFIAGLLAERLQPWLRHPRRVRRALDLCTGSGCLAVLLAKTFPRARVDAVDISRAALAVAKRNLSLHRLGRRVSLVRSDVFSALRGERYDLIVANPPYVSVGAMRKLPREYRHEPRLALAGGHDGLDVVRTILREAAAHLTARGLLVVEAGHHRRRVERALPHLPFTWPETGAGDDCVFLLERAELQAPEDLRGGRATRAVAGSRRR